ATIAPTGRERQTACPASRPAPPLGQPTAGRLLPAIDQSRFDQPFVGGQRVEIVASIAPSRRNACIDIASAKGVGDLGRNRLAGISPDDRPRGLRSQQHGIFGRAPPAEVDARHGSAKSRWHPTLYGCGKPETLVTGRRRSRGKASRGE